MLCFLVLLCPYWHLPSLSMSLQYILLTGRVFQPLLLGKKNTEEGVMVFSVCLDSSDVTVKPKHLAEK